MELEGNMREIVGQMSINLSYRYGTTTFSCQKRLYHIYIDLSIDNRKIIHNVLTPVLVKDAIWVVFSLFISDYS